MDGQQLKLQEPKTKIPLFDFACIGLERNYEFNTNYLMPLLVENCPCRRRRLRVLQTLPPDININFNARVCRMSGSVHLLINR